MTNFKMQSKRIPTNEEGIFYKSIINENGKEIDKTYIIRYRENDTDKLKTIGKYSQGIRINYCKQIRNEILMKLRLGEEPPTVAKKKKKDSAKLDDFAEIYFNTKKERPHQTFHNHLISRAAPRNGLTDVTFTVNSAQAPSRHTRASA